MVDTSNSQRFTERLNGDLTAADLKLSLFVAAALSYRHDTVLMPFPPMYVCNGEKDHSKLICHVNSLPSLSDVNQNNALPQEECHLLEWLYDTKVFDIKSCPSTQFDEIQNLTGHTIPVPEPNYVFQVIHGAASEIKYQDRAKDKEVMYAYHGSRLENFHSILNFGLNSHMSKNALFGEGTYLSSELSVSLPYCPSGQGWNKSLIGDSLACIAVCEIIDDPAVKCHIKDQKGEVSKARTQVAGSEGGSVPEKYYIVQNNDLIRVKYLLVYASKRTKASRKKMAWWKKYKFELMIAFYAVLLLVVGLINSRTFQRYIQQLFK